jgi:hypothetical protein
MSLDRRLLLLVESFTWSAFILWGGGDILSTRFLLYRVVASSLYCITPSVLACA